MLRLIAMRYVTLPLLLVLAACGGQDVQAQPPSVQGSPAASPSPTASPRPGVPQEFWAACGKPGSRVEVKSVPVTVRHADCDLTGVTLAHDGVGMGVPKPGTGAAGNFDAAPGGTTRAATVDRDKKSKDVTFNVRSY